MQFIKTILSYIIPFKLDSKSGKGDVRLGVYYDSGKIKLFTPNTNYSGGELKHVFRKALTNIDFKKSDKVLILGFGLGSIWEVIRKEKQSECFIAGVDYDEVIHGFVARYNSEVLQDDRTELYHTEALEFLNSATENFDYIFIDLFIDTKVCDVVFQSDFRTSLKSRLSTRGLVVLNTMDVNQTEMHCFEPEFCRISYTPMSIDNKMFYFTNQDGQTCGRIPLRN